MQRAVRVSDFGLHLVRLLIAAPCVLAGSAEAALLLLPSKVRAHVCSFPLLASGVTSVKASSSTAPTHATCNTISSARGSTRLRQPASAARAPPGVHRPRATPSTAATTARCPQQARRLQGSSARPRRTSSRCTLTGRSGNRPVETTASRTRAEASDFSLRSVRRPICTTVPTPHPKSRVQHGSESSGTVGRFAFVHMYHTRGLREHTTHGT